MKKRTLAAASIGLLLGLLQAPGAGAAPASHFVGRVQERSDYRSVGGEQVSHEYGRLIHDGARTVWQFGANANATAWSISFSVPSAPNATRNRQQVCPVVRVPGHQAVLSVQIWGVKPGEMQRTQIEIGNLIVSPSTTYKRLCITYNLKRRAWDSVTFELGVPGGGGGPIRVDELRLYQGGTSGPSVYPEVAAKRNG